MRLSDKEIIEEARRSADESISALELMKNHFDENFVNAVRLAVDSKKIFVSGIGKSGLIARKIASTFSSVGLPSFFLHPVEALHGDIGMVERKDLAILLSKSGATDEIVRILPFLKSRSVSTIAIVGSVNSYLANNSDVVLNGFVERESCPLNIAPTTSSLVALAIGDALAVCAMKIKNLSLQEFAKNHPLGQIGKNITIKVENIMHKDKNLPTVDKFASFKDALVEITDKGLGCACVVDDDFYLEGIITDGDVRRLFHDTDDIRGLKVADVMTKNPVTVQQSAYLGEALSLMERRPSQINVLPVLNKRNKCVGVVRLHDIVRSGL